MKKIIYSSLLVLMAACASSNSSDSNSDYGAAYTTDEPRMEVAKPVATRPPAPKPPEKIEVAKAREGNESDLDKALKSGHDDKIRTASMEALLRNPKDIKALNSLAMSYYRGGQFTGSQFLLNRALKVDENSQEILNNLGVVQLAQGEQREAIQSFKKVLVINGRNEYAAANLGQIYIANKDYAKAAMAFDIATSNGVRDWKTMNNYGIALTGTKNYDKAYGVFKDISKSQSSQREIMYNYAILLVDHMGKYDEGLEIIHRLQFIGAPGDTRKKVAELETKAKAGAKK